MKELTDDQRRKLACFLIFFSVVGSIAVVMPKIYFSPEPDSQTAVTGYVTTISDNGEYTLFIESRDNYDRYDIENNVSTFRYQGTIYQTHRVTLWRGNNRVAINNVVYYFFNEG